MTPSLTFWALIALVLAAVAIISIQSFRSQPSHANIAKLMVTAVDYQHQLKDAGAVIPPSVSLDQLISRSAHVIPSPGSPA